MKAPNASAAPLPVRGLTYAAVVRSYCGSASYALDVAATRSVWLRQSVLPAAGTFVFLAYLTVPELLTVRPGHGGLARSALDGYRERAFLLRLLGLTAEPRWSGGIKNAKVQRHTALLAQRHSGFPGMKQEYMNYVAGTIALSPLAICAQFGEPVPGGDRSRYWRYIRHGMSLLGVSMRSEQAVMKDCRAFAGARAGPSVEGRRLLESLTRHHPSYVEMAKPALFEPIRTALAELQGESIQQ
jgi:hypothetical protein